MLKKFVRVYQKKVVKQSNYWEQYNIVSLQIEPSFLSFSFDEIQSPACTIWQTPSCEPTGQIPFNIKQDVMEAYLMKKKCEKELLLLKVEMHNVAEYWNLKKGCIKDLILQFSESATSHTQFSRGCICLLKRVLWETELYHSQVISAFSSVSQTPDHNLHEIENSDSSEYESDSTDEDSTSDG